MNIKKIGDQERGMATVLYGSPSSGKTHQMGYFPKEETIVLDIDGGILTLAGTEISVFPIKEDL